ncbi:hypothetical protein ZWY2020_049809 [Hordeum vulgare]|nr:hypothetical protein ZWY2020_049809 [Hordeum vulgare]
MAQRSFTFCRGSPALSLLGLTGAVAASAFSDLSVFLSCSRGVYCPGEIGWCLWMERGGGTMRGAGAASLTSLLLGLGSLGITNSKQPEEL